MARFQDQVAIVTGGADGLGKGICQRLGSEGAHVVMFDFNESKMAETKAEFDAAGISSSAIQVDVASEESVRSSIDKVVQEHGRLDIMINCAGIVGEKLCLCAVCKHVTKSCVVQGQLAKRLRRLPARISIEFRASTLKAPST